MAAPPHLLESIAKVKQYEADLLEVARCYEADPHSSEKNFCDDLTTGKFEAAITFPHGRDATSWNLDDDAFKVRHNDRSLSIVLAGEITVTFAILKWTLEAKRRCVIWNVQEMRHAYYDPEEVVCKDGRVCDLLQNLDLLDCMFVQDTSNKLSRLMHNKASIVADFSWGVKKKDEDGADVWERDPDQAPEDTQKYLIYVLCRRHFVKLNAAWCMIEYSQNRRT
jgi:hypothetical protein